MLLADGFALRAAGRPAAYGVLFADAATLAADPDAAAWLLLPLHPALTRHRLTCQGVRTLPFYVTWHWVLAG